MRHALSVLMTASMLCLFLPPAVEGHHGYAGFDKQAEVSFHATVTGFHFVSPHCVVEFDAIDEKGQIQKWQGELTSPSHLAPRGWTATSLEAGDKITITGHRASNGVPSLWVTKIVLASGKELKLGSRD